MIELFSTQFWIAILFIFQFIFVIFLFVLVKKNNRLNEFLDDQDQWDAETKESMQTAKHVSSVIEMLEPLMREARKTAQKFDEQIKEKKRLLKELNDALDNRIININLLLSRAETQHKKMVEKHNAMVNVVMPESTVKNNISPGQASDQMRDQTRDQSGDQMGSQAGDMGIGQQHQIIQMYEQNIDMDNIAQKLSVPRGEVQMVIDLKEKFLEMERRHP